MVTRHRTINLTTVAALLLGLALPQPALGQQQADDRFPGCAFDDSRLDCTYPALDYEVRLPKGSASGEAQQVVVLYHDGGRGPESLIAVPGLVSTFTDAGYAVVMPRAIERENRRIGYGGRRPTLLAGFQAFRSASASRRHLVVERDGGKMEVFRWREDTGWYFRTVDEIVYIPDQTDTHDADYIGRDEHAALTRILADVSKTHGVAGTPALIAGVGHGASVVWDLACHAPQAAGLFSPIGAGFWNKMPHDCRAGANLVHTHREETTFWPFEGQFASEHRYRRVGIDDMLAMLSKVNGCNAPRGREDTAAGGLVTTVWRDCDGRSGVALMMSDGTDPVPGGWPAAMLERIGPATATDSAAPPPAPALAEPSFKGAGDKDNHSGFLKPGERKGGHFQQVE